MSTESAIAPGSAASMAATQATATRAGQRAVASVVRGRDAVLGLREAWRRLFAQSTHASVHMSYACCATWLLENKQRGDAAALCLSEGEDLVGLLPVMLTRRALATVATPLGTGRGAYLGVLVRDGDISVAKRMADEWHKARLASYLVCHDVSSGDAPTRAFLQALEEQGWRSHWRRRNIVLAAALAPDFDEFLTSNKSAKSRRKMRNRDRALKESHNVETRRYRAAEVAAEVIRRCAELHAESWLKKRGGAYLCEPAYQRMLGAMAEEGLADVWIMRIDGEDAAFAASGTAHGTYYYEWPAVRTKFVSMEKANISVGQTLLSEILARACAEGVREFDFGHGDGEYKRSWSNAQRHVDRVVLGRGVVGGLASRTVGFMWWLAEQDAIKARYKKLKRKLRRRRQAGEEEGGGAGE